MKIKGPEIHSFLSEDERLRAIQIAEDLSNFWSSPAGGTYNRLAMGPNFFTLGYPTYVPMYMIDHYCSILCERPPLNPIMSERLDWLYKKIIHFFENLLEDKVRLNTHDFSFPGYNIFLSNSTLSNSSGPFHADTDHLFLPWKKKLKELHHISFTVMLEVPSVGARFEWKNASYYSGSHFSKAKLEKILDSMTLHALDYVQGGLLVHDGFLFHRIGPWEGKKATDRRISIQGNLVELEDGWEIYW